MKHGITTETFKHMYVGPGAVYKAFTAPETPGTLMGATMGGNEVRVDRQWRVPELDGSRGPVKGTRKLISEVPSLKARFVEMTLENLKTALAGTTSTTVGTTHDKITSTGEVTDADYTDIALIGELEGSDEPIIFVVKNAMSTEPIAIATGTGKDDVAYEVTFTGHYADPQTKTAPYEIYVPKITTTP